MKFLIWPVMENAHIVEHFERLKVESEAGVLPCSPSSPGAVCGLAELRCKRGLAEIAGRGWLECFAFIQHGFTCMVGEAEPFSGEVGDVTCFVIDAHRPVLRLALAFEAVSWVPRLQNLSKHNQRVIVLDDDPIAEAQGVA